MKLLLLSGGLDSTAVAALARPDHCLTINYGQLAAEAEARAAAQVARELGLPHTLIAVPAGEVGSGLMSDADASSAGLSGAAPEWWPFRNQLLLTLAAAWGVTRGFQALQIGSVAGDGDRHQDGTEEFRERFSALVRMQEGGMHVEAPAATFSTVELIQRARVPERVLAWTHSCHRANLPCAQCPGCIKRAEVLRSAHLLR